MSNIAVDAHAHHRWLLSTGASVYTSVEVARMVTQLLLQLALLQPAVDDLGQVLQPLPKAHRLMTAARCFPHICQVWSL